MCTWETGWVATRQLSVASPDRRQSTYTVPRNLLPLIRPPVGRQHGQHKKLAQNTTALTLDAQPVPRSDTLALARTGGKLLTDPGINLDTCVTS